VVAVLPTERPVDSDPLAHCNLSCDIDITIAPLRVSYGFLSCLLEQDMYALPRDLLCRRIAGFLFHCLVTLLPDVVIYQRKGYKRNGDFDYVETIRIFFLTLFGATACNASAPAASTPTGAITPDKVIRHNRKAKGRFGGTGTVPSVNRCFTIC
jgi:hypothetical protein